MISSAAFVVVIFLFLLLIDRKLARGNVLSGGSLLIYFSLIPALSHLYFVAQPSKLDSMIYSMVHPSFRDDHNVIFSLLLFSVGVFFAFVMYHLSERTPSKLTNWLFFNVLRLDFLEREDNLGFRSKSPIDSSTVGWWGYAFFMIGTLLLCYMMSAVGGIFDFWLNIQLRAEKTAGLGYVHSLAFFFLYIGTVLLYFQAAISRRGVRSLVVILLGSIMLGALGARGPILSLWIAVIFIGHYRIKRLPGIISFKFIIILVGFAAFALSVLQFRSGEVSIEDFSAGRLGDGLVNSFEQGFIGRVGRLERDIVIVGYFDANEYWFGSSYLGVLVAPIPRSIFEAKPPVDSGMYLRSMALGRKINPPMPVNSLNGSGWPEDNWAGYMNFGVIGYIFLMGLSGWVYGSIFSSFTRNGAPLCLGAIVGVYFSKGLPILSPKGIVMLLTLLLCMALLRIIVISVHALRLGRLRLRKYH